MSCDSNCVNNADDDSCCVLEPTPADDDHPLGFQQYPFPGTDSGNPSPCIRVEFPASAYSDVSNVNYLIVAVSNCFYCYFIL